MLDLGIVNLCPIRFFEQFFISYLLGSMCHSIGDMDCALVFFCDFYFQLFNFTFVKLNFMLETF
jgi:hypothetical protein